MISFRAEASEKHGLGHLKRCLVLAQAVRKAGEDVLFLCPEDNQGAIKLIEESKRTFYTIPANLSYEEEVEHYPEDCQSLVVDIYHQENIKNSDKVIAYLNILAEKKVKVAFMDGLFNEAFRPESNAPHLHALIQPYLGAEKDVKPDADHWIKGAAFAVMDSAYANQPIKKRKDVKNILITFGGADPRALTISVMKALESEPLDINIRVIIGPLFSIDHIEQIKNWAGKNTKRFDIRGPESNMIPHYKWADIALSTSASSRYEFAAMGLPSVFTAYYPDHIRSSKVFAFSGVARYIGLYTELKDNDWSDAVKDLINNEKKWKNMSQAGQKNIDGFGAERLVTKLLEIFK